VSRGNRLDGLDIARFVAFVGMVIVNFSIVMGAESSNTIAAQLSAMLAGKAAATFVVLSGLGLGLANIVNPGLSVLSVVKKALFLLVLGLLNMLVFEADILHYYAFYFIFGAFFLSLSVRQLISVIVILNLAFVLMILVFNYDVGWDWENYSYSGFWTANGFLRNLFFNGWHPVVPWIGFLLFGFILSRLSLSDKAIQNRLIVFGAIILIAVEVVARALRGATEHIDPELPLLLTTSPVPPMPLFTIAGIATACFVTGLCLRLSALLKLGIVNVLASAGRQTLTLYIAHILIGMGTLQWFGMLGNQTASAAVIAAIVFCASALVHQFV